MGSAVNPTSNAFSLIVVRVRAVSLPASGTGFASEPSVIEPSGFRVQPSGSDAPATGAIAPRGKIKICGRATSAREIGFAGVERGAKLRDRPVRVQVTDAARKTLVEIVFEVEACWILDSGRGIDS